MCSAVPLLVCPTAAGVRGGLGESGGREGGPRPACAVSRLAGACSGLCEGRAGEAWLPELSFWRRKGTPPTTLSRGERSRGLAQASGAEGGEDTGS